MGTRVPGRRASAAWQNDEGIDQLKDSLAVQQAIGSGLVRTAFLALLGPIRCAAQDGSTKAFAPIDEGFAHAEQMSEGGYLAELHRVRGELLRRSGNQAAAEESLRLAIARSIEQQAKSFELRAATGLARLLLPNGRRDEARAVLAPIYEWFTEGHTTEDLVAAKRPSPRSTGDDSSIPPLRSSACSRRSMRSSTGRLTSRHPRRRRRL